MHRRLFFGAGLLAPSAAALASQDERPALPQRTLSTTRGRYPNVLLTTHEGKRVRFYDDVISGNKLNIINMMYTQCPDICGGTMVNLERVQGMFGERMGKDVFIWSITLDPRHDKPDVLRRYAQIVGAGAGWTFLSGRPTDIERIRRAIGYVDRDPVVDKELTQHLGMLRIGNDAADRWMSTPGIARPKQIVQEVLWVGLAKPA